MLGEAEVHYVEAALGVAGRGAADAALYAAERARRAEVRRAWSTARAGALAAVVAGDNARFASYAAVLPARVLSGIWRFAKPADARPPYVARPVYEHEGDVQWA